MDMQERAQQSTITSKKEEGLLESKVDPAPGENGRGLVKGPEEGHLESDRGPTVRIHQNLWGIASGKK